MSYCLKLCLHVACASAFASTSASSFAFSQWLTQRMGLKHSLCVLQCHHLLSTKLDADVDAGVTCKPPSEYFTSLLNAVHLKDACWSNVAICGICSTTLTDISVADPGFPTSHCHFRIFMDFYF